MHTRLEHAVRRHLRDPGTVRDLTRLTGGAVKLTWSFDVVVGSALVPLVLQQTPPERAAQTPPLGEPGIRGADDAARLRAARAVGVPAPHVRAVLEPDDHPKWISDQTSG